MRKRPPRSPDRWTTRVRRWGRRHRPLVSGLAGLLVMGIVGLVVGLILVGNKERERASEARTASASRDVALLNQERARELALQQIATIEAAFVKVSEDALRDVPGMQAVRRELLDRAAAHSAKLLDIWSDNLEIRARVGQAWYQVGKMCVEVGLEKEGAELLEKAYRVQKVLVDQSVNLVHQRDLGRSAALLGSRYRRLGNLALALQYLSEALTVQRKILANHPLTRGSHLWAELRCELGLTMQWTARATADVKEIRTAEELYTQQLVLLSETVKLAPNEPWPREQFAEGLLQASLFLRGSKPGQALQLLDEARELLEKAPLPMQQRLTLQEQLGKVYNALFLVLRPRDVAEAIGMLKKAVAQREKLARDNPLVARYKGECASSQGNLAVQLQAAGLVAEALPLFQQAVQHSEAQLAITDVADTRAGLNLHQQNLANCYRKLGQRGKAVEVLLRCRERNPRNSGLLYKFALNCYGYAQDVSSGATVLSKEQTAEQQRYLDLAVTLLREAVQHGYCEWAALRRAGIVEALRQRPEGPRLLKELTDKGY